MIYLDKDSCGLYFDKSYPTQWSFQIIFTKISVDSGPKAYLFSGTIKPAGIHLEMKARKPHDKIWNKIYLEGKANLKFLDPIHYSLEMIHLTVIYKE